MYQRRPSSSSNNSNNNIICIIIINIIVIPIFTTPNTNHILRICHILLGLVIVIVIIIVILLAHRSVLPHPIQQHTALQEATVHPSRNAPAHAALPHPPPTVPGPP